MKLSVIVPVYNEASHLEEVMKMLFAAPCPVERQWIIVNDASTDGSGEILEKLRPALGFELIDFPENRGKGSAIRAGIERATGDWVIIQDADFEYDPEDVPSLLVPLMTQKADVVYGSRFKKTVTQVHRTYHYFVNRFLTFLSNLFSGIYLTDMETCFKVFKREFLQSMNLRSKRFGIEVELTAYVAKSAARVMEIPIHYYPRTRLQGKKISWKDGVAALYHLVRFNFFVSESEAFKTDSRAVLQPFRKTPIKSAR